MPLRLRRLRFSSGVWALRRRSSLWSPCCIHHSCMRAHHTGGGGWTVRARALGLDDSNTRSQRLARAEISAVSLSVETVQRRRFGSAQGDELAICNTLASSQKRVDRRARSPKHLARSSGTSHDSPSTMPHRPAALMRGAAPAPHAGRRPGHGLRLRRPRAHLRRASGLFINKGEPRRCHWRRRLLVPARNGQVGTRPRRQY